MCFTGFVCYRNKNMGQIFRCLNYSQREFHMTCTTILNATCHICMCPYDLLNQPTLLPLIYGGPGRGKS